MQKTTNMQRETNQVVRGDRHVQSVRRHQETRSLQGHHWYQDPQAFPSARLVQGFHRVLVSPGFQGHHFRLQSLGHRLDRVSLKFGKLEIWISPVKFSLFLYFENFEYFDSSDRSTFGKYTDRFLSFEIARMHTGCHTVKTHVGDANLKPTNKSMEISIESDTVDSPWPPTTPCWPLWPSSPALPFPPATP